MNSLTTSTSTPTKEQITTAHVKYWLTRFEHAVEEHAFIGAQPVEYHKSIRRDYRETKEKLTKILEILTAPPTQQN